MEALYQAATHGEDLVAEYVEQELAARTLTRKRLHTQFKPQHLDTVPTLAVEQHSLQSYDQLLNHDPIFIWR